MKLKDIFLNLVPEIQKLREREASLLKYIEFNENLINNREKRLHPFVAETIDLVLKNGLIGIDSKLTNQNVEGGELLGDLFDKYGSDRNSRHSYAGIYNSLINKFKKIRIIEIGLGSINDYPYAGLNPGGSIRAFREYLPEAKIYGLDIDSDSVAKISEVGFVMDQTNSQSIETAISKLIEIESCFEIIIDDGFHDPHANIRTYLSFYNLLAAEGFYIIEDVHSSLINFYILIAEHLPGEMKIYDLRSERNGIEDNILIVFKKNASTLIP